MEFCLLERMATRCFFLQLLVIVEAKTGTIASTTKVQEPTGVKVIPIMMIITTLWNSIMMIGIKI